MVYFKSKEIEVYPAGFRDDTCVKSKLITEENLTEFLSSYNLLTDGIWEDSRDNSYYILKLKGYAFKFKAADFNTLLAGLEPSDYIYKVYAALKFRSLSDDIGNVLDNIDNTTDGKWYCLDQLVKPETNTYVFARGNFKSDLTYYIKNGNEYLAVTVTDEAYNNSLDSYGVSDTYYVKYNLVFKGLTLSFGSVPTGLTGSPIGIYVKDCNSQFTTYRFIPGGADELYEEYNGTELEYSLSVSTISVTGLPAGSEDTVITVPNKICYGTDDNNFTQYTVENIASGAFCDSGITSVTLNADLKTISSNSFSININNEDKVCGITAITIPPNVTEIQDEVFKNCTGLAVVTFSDNGKLESIGDSCFEGCTEIKNLSIPYGVKTIGEGAFYGCCGISGNPVQRVLKIPETIKTIGSNAFGDDLNTDNNTKVKKIELDIYEDRIPGKPWGALYSNIKYKALLIDGGTIDLSN